jgi:GNAT superfamily N-acetyltransferase
VDEQHIEQVRESWRKVLGAPEAFRRPGTVVVARRVGRTAGQRWLTVVSLGRSRCVLAPADLADDLDRLIAGRLADPTEARAMLGRSIAVLGPATLAFTATEPPPNGHYGPTAHANPHVSPADPGSSAAAAPGRSANADPSHPDPSHPDPSHPDPSHPDPSYPDPSGHDRTAGQMLPATGTSEPGAAELDVLGAACDPADAAESALAAWTHWIRVIREGDRVVAAAGAQVWAGALAHVGVLTRPDCRRRGLGAAVAAAVVRDALAAGLVAQWRARTELTASRRLAGSLGFVELGQQVSYELAGTPSARR